MNFFFHRRWIRFPGCGCDYNWMLCMNKTFAVSKLDIQSMIDSWWQRPKELSIMNEAARKKTELSETEEGQSECLTSLHTPDRIALVMFYKEQWLSTLSPSCPGWQRGQTALVPVEIASSYVHSKRALAVLNLWELFFDTLLFYRFVYREKKKMSGDIIGSSGCGDQEQRLLLEHVVEMWKKDWNCMQNNQLKIESVCFLFFWFTPAVSPPNAAQCTLI